MTLFPFIINKVTLDATPKKFFDALEKLCEDDFDFTRTEKQYDSLFKPESIKEYEAEISGNSFKARKLEKTGFRNYSFIKNTVYGWYKQEGGKLVFKYLITFNIFTCVLFIGMSFGSGYLLLDAITKFNSSSWDSLFYAVIGPAVLIFVFNMMAEDDKIFIEDLIKKATATYSS